MSTDPPTDAPTPLCPQCGYDLRGLASPRCPECGFDLTTIGPAVSTIPWSNRYQIGRVRAYLATVRLFTLRSAWLKLEMARPVSIADARRFWLISVTLLAVPLLCWFAFAWWRAGDLGFVFEAAILGRVRGAYRWLVDSGWIAQGSMPPEWWMLNIQLPFATGLTRWGVVPILLPVTLLGLTGVHTYLFHPRGLHPRRADRAIALAFYLVAPLLPLIVALLVTGGFGRLSDADGTLGALLSDKTNIGLALLKVGWTFLVALLAINVVVRPLVALSFTTRCGWLYLSFAAIAMPAMWIGVFLVVAGLVPWLVGVIWFSIVSIV